MSIGGFTLIKWVGLLAVVVAILENQRQGRSVGLARSAQGKAFVLLFLIVLASWLLDGYWAFTFPLQTYLSFVIFFFVTLSMVTTEARARQVMWAVTISMFVASLYILKEYVVYSRIYGAGFRPFGGLFEDSNYYALSAIMAMPLIYYLAKITEKGAVRYALYSVFFVFVLAVAFSMSRGGIIGLAAMAFMALILSKHKSRAIALFAVLVILGLYFAPERLWNRFEDTTITTTTKSTYGTAASTTRRWNLIKAGGRMISDHPIKGVGLGKFKANSTYYEPLLGRSGIAHSSYVELAAELGLPALILFLLIIMYSYRDLIRMRRRLKELDSDPLLPNALIVSLTGFVVAGTFLSGQNTKLFWLMVFLSIAIKRYELYDLAADKDSEPEERAAFEHPHLIKRSANL
jgi:O-antigen ligase